MNTPTLRATLLPRSLWSRASSLATEYRQCTGGACSTLPPDIGMRCIALASRGHLTASAWVVNHEATHGLVLLHAKIGRWLQPGGHADGEASLAFVALREATEETGIEGLEVWSDPIDIDVHLFVNRTRTEPDHLHFDVRFLIRAPTGAVAHRNHESEALRWIAESQLVDPELRLDASTRRLARYGFDLACAVRSRRGSAPPGHDCPS